MSFYFINREFFDNFYKLSNLFNVPPNGPTRNRDSFWFDSYCIPEPFSGVFREKYWFDQFRTTAIRCKAQNWNWGVYRRLPDGYEKSFLPHGTNKFENAVRSRIRLSNQIWDENTDVFPSNWDTSNWSFLETAMDLDWNGDLNGMMDGWDDYYSTKDSSEIIGRVATSIYDHMMNHRQELTCATHIGTFLEAFGMVLTIKGIYNLFKYRSCSFSLLCFPFAMFLSNVVVVTPTIKRITRLDL